MININIKSTNFSMTPDIEEYITSKISGVDKFLQITPDENVLVEFEIERSTGQKSGDVYRAEVNLSHKGTLYRAEETTSDARAAVDMVRDQLEKQIRRTKGKKSDLYEKGARIIKGLMRKNND